MDNCIGILNLLHIAKNLKNGILVFTQGEEKEDGGLGSIAKYIYEKCKVSQILISDVTSVTTGIKHGDGSVIGVGVEELPNPQFLRNITDILTKNKLDVQAEIRKTGKSDFSRLLLTPYNFEMCYIGCPVSHKHSSNEKIYKKDIINMFEVYTKLMRSL